MEYYYLQLINLELCQDTALQLSVVQVVEKDIVFMCFFAMRACAKVSKGRARGRETALKRLEWTNNQFSSLFKVL